MGRKPPYKPSYVKEDTALREPIVKLGKMITDRVPYHLGLKKLTSDDPEYWALAAVATDEEAELALKMGVRKPKTFAQLKAISGLEEERLQQLLDHMSWTGLVEYNWENENREKQYLVPMYVPGSAEFTNMNEELINKNPEMGKFFDYMATLPLEKITPMVPPGGAGIGMHVIPVEKAIEMNNESISFEHISHWLDKYEGKYAASPCSCRRSRKTYNEGCADDETDWCIAVGDMADYVVETGKGGRYVSKEEVLEILKKAEDNGFVHQITNIDGQDKIFAICNCNVNVCYALRTSQLYNTPNLSRSAYVAKVTKEDCVACGRCVEVCPAGAVKLGQKLCRKDGSEVKYPKHVLPSQKKWTEDDWDWDYRDNNRINCYDSGTAPCKTACPAHVAVQGYLKLAAQGKYTEALELIKKNNPLPAVCGHICNRRCEEACTRGTIDQAVAIDEVKKFLAARDLNADTRFIPKKVIPKVNGEFEEKIAIIGGGPAGLSCAFYLAEKGYRPTIFEKNKRAGGMLVYGIPSYKLEKDVVQSEIDIIKEMGVTIKTGVEVGKDITIEELREQGYKAFYIAIGCQGGRKAGIPGEDAEGVVTAVDFLHAVTDDESLKVEGDAVVIGGGNVAIDVSRSAVRCGASNVKQFCLESRDIMPASDEEVQEAEEDGALINCGWGPKEILTENGKVTGIVFKKCLSVFDADHRFNPQYDESDTVTIKCQHVFLSIGQSIVWGNLLNGSCVELGRGNGAVADSLTYQTTEPDIFVGGDVYTGPKFAIDAIAAGKQGAISIHRFVQPHSSLTIGRNRNDFKELNKDDISIKDYDTCKRQIPGKSNAIADPKHSFRDAKLVFTEEQVKAETARCLSCGASVVDTNKCIGCGLCTTKCEFDAIHLYRDNPDCSVMRKSEDKLKYILPYAAKQRVNIRKQTIKVKLKKVKKK
ncbi:FAD-dependent oxidoreductase [Butyrivibrio sp. XPD2002]|uniref:FAD-dependent oxidoreductase n=1 Tax=Butyrivibrio sp. XPD2002 TaxID=1280665 RepID=UPI0003F55120|nr:FAD-dependent oxidoreductase [Butyrivibrio sp. XPD2002]